MLAMKIEIGESLIVSWLKHIEKCQVVQMNWKPSTNFWQLDNYTEIEKVIHYATDYFEKENGFQLFKNTTSLTQIIKQAELDVLGIQLINGKLEKVYAVDIAFHEGGLTYGVKNETAARIVKKIIRTVICINGYFGVRSGEILFASPKVHKSTLNEIIPLIKEIERILKIFHLNFQVSFIVNEDFEQRILNPVIQISNQVADTSELFMRSVQMMKLFQHISQQEKDQQKILKPLPEVTTSTTEKSKPIMVKTNHTPQFSIRKELGIGKLVVSAFDYLIQNNLLTDEDLALLTSPKYSKETFDVNYPVLKEVLNDSDLRDTLGYRRYYAKDYYIHHKRYGLTREWFERSRKKLER